MQPILHYSNPFMQVQRAPSLAKESKITALHMSKRCKMMILILVLLHKVMKCHIVASYKEQRADTINKYFW